MSNDTMPCGCEGHADNEGLCRYPALERELAAERKRREEAERERDEEREAVGLIAEDRDSAIARAECAETDNAALLKALDRAKVGLARVLRFGTGTSDASQPERNTFGEEVSAIDAALFGSHHGAAMLERMRALEAWVARIPHDVSCGSRIAPVPCDCIRSTIPTIV